MTKTKLFLQRLSFGSTNASVLGAFALAQACFFSYSSLVEAQTAKPELSSVVRFVPPTVLVDRNVISGRRQGGASRRGQCSNVRNPITALVPATQETLGGEQGEDPALNRWESVWGLTTDETPTLWFYVPYQLTAQLPVTFVLQDKQGKTIYKTSFASETQPGIVSFRLTTKTRLEVGKMYQWYFAIDCGTQVPIFVKGWVQRVAPNPSLMNQLKAATPRERAALYATNGIWHDALTTLASLRNTNPTDATLLKDWVSLLDSVGLEAVANEQLSAARGSN